MFFSNLQAIKKTYPRWLLFLAIIFICDYFGLFKHIFEIDYKYFEYPLNIDLIPIVQEIKLKGSTQIEAINHHDFHYILPVKSCNTDLSLLVLVKSSLNHFTQRETIRKTWGLRQQSEHISLMFLLGNSNGLSKINNDIKNEFNWTKDLIQEDFYDSYYNNTLKTIMGLKWATIYCPRARYVMFSDDDMYINITNVLKLLKELDKKQEKKHFVGYVFFSSPHRHKSSKWYITVEEYPYSMYPPYVTAGAFILSAEATSDLYYASLYTKKFRFDDIYLGIIAKKMGISPQHNSNFYFWKKTYSKDNYKDLIASHGYEVSSELIEVWLDMQN